MQNREIRSQERLDRILLYAYIFAVAAIAYYFIYSQLIRIFKKNDNKFLDKVRLQIAGNTQMPTSDSSATKILKQLSQSSRPTRTAANDLPANPPKKRSSKQDLYPIASSSRCSHLYAKQASKHQSIVDLDEGIDLTAQNNFFIQKMASLYRLLDQYKHENKHEYEPLRLMVVHSSAALIRHCRISDIKNQPSLTELLHQLSAKNPASNNRFHCTIKTVEFHSWFKCEVIPLMLYLYQQSTDKSADKQLITTQDYADALKMLIVYVGDMCKLGALDAKTIIEIENDKTFVLMADKCHSLRNKLAHNNQVLDSEIQMFIRQVAKINPDAFNIANDNLINIIGNAQMRADNNEDEIDSRAHYHIQAFS